ncbi:MAG: RNA polymerase sigma factor [Actinomycetota bacterium]|nr:RNA polymerase sigma factor [Actinomycetota bacterium]
MRVQHRITSPAREERAATDDRSLDRREAELVRGLVIRAQAGDKEAFGALYRAHHGSVHRLASFYLNGSAEDAVAETFVRAWKALPKFKDTGAPFSAWLYGIARNIVADELKAKRRVEPRETLPEAAWSPDADDRIAVTAVINRLPREQRQVIEMKYLIGMLNSEVADALGRSVGAVNAIQWRGLKKMRELMGCR